MKTNWIGVTEEVTIKIEGRLQPITLSVEYVPQAKDNCYFLSALTETGFELCSTNRGYFDYYVKAPRVSKLRSELSVASDMLDTLERLKQAIESIADDIILTTRMIQAKISGTECYAWVRTAQFFPASNIYSRQSGSSISWYCHDVFKQGDIQLRVFRNSQGYLRFEADERDLYDTEKLQALYNSEGFQHSKLAFFKYNELRRLLGIPVTGDPTRMSGLFHDPKVQE